MQSFQTLSALFDEQFSKRHFPSSPKNLYDASQYILNIGGKRVRPVSVLMGNELFSDIAADAYQVANAIELFHNFSLIHDDIMDKAPRRRGVPTVHMNYGESTALLHAILSIFNQTARQVCEGQQLDMDFEQMDYVSLDDYMNMITLKTSVLLAASLQMGAILGGAGIGNREHIYEFGKNLGIAFQVQDDYLDCFGDPAKFGKQVGGDILSNKKTFLMIHALEVASDVQKKELQLLLESNPEDKVARVLQLFKDCKADAWAASLKEKYYAAALKHLDDIAVLNARKVELQKLASYLLERDS